MEDFVGVLSSLRTEAFFVDLSRREPEDGEVSTKSSILWSLVNLGHRGNPPSLILLRSLVLFIGTQHQRLAGRGERNERGPHLVSVLCSSNVPTRPRVGGGLLLQRSSSSIVDRGSGIIESYNFHVKIIFIWYRMKKDIILSFMCQFILVSIELSHWNVFHDFGFLVTEMGSGYQSLQRKRVYADPLSAVTETSTYRYVRYIYLVIDWGGNHFFVNIGLFMCICILSFWLIWTGL
jgi:hypothetical protein